MMIAFADFHARYTHCCDKFAAVCFLMCFLTRVFRLQAMYSQTKDVRVCQQGCADICRMTL